MIKTCSLVPEDRLNYMVTDEATLEEITENNSKLDLANFFVVDQAMPRTELGVGVWEVESFVQNNTSVKLSGGSQASNPRPSPSLQPARQPVVSRCQTKKW